MFVIKRGKYMKKNIFVVIIACFLITLSTLFLFNLNNKKLDNKKVKKIINKTIENSKDDITNAKDSYGNEDIIGNITVSGTDIDEYIVQTTDNNYYLNHNLKKEYDIAGAVFMDYRNSVDDKKILIFGHNARKLDTVPFHDLEKYLDESFYRENKYVDLKFNEDTKWLIFSVMIVKKGNNTHMKLEFDDNSWLEHLNYLKSNSIYDTGVDVSFDDRIVVIQTCNYHPENTYILICAKKYK